jgi:hypothetical protein
VFTNCTKYCSYHKYSENGLFAAQQAMSELVFHRLLRSELYYLYPVDTLVNTMIFTEDS